MEQHYNVQIKNVKVNFIFHVDLINHSSFLKRKFIVAENVLNLKKRNLRL